MKHKGLICLSGSATNEDYKRKLKISNKIFAFFILLGAALILLSAILEKNGLLSKPYSFSGFYSGFGGGMIGVSLFNIIRNIRTVKDEKRLTKARIAATDERTAEINSKSTTAAYYATFIIFTAVLFIASMFFPVLLYFIPVFILIAALSYFIAAFYFNRKM